MKNNNVDGVGAEQIHEIGNFMDKWGNLPEMQEDLYSLLSSHTDSIEAKYREELKGKLEDKRAKLEGEHPKENIIANKAFNLGIDTAISLINNNQK